VLSGGGQAPTYEVEAQHWLLGPACGEVFSWCPVMDFAMTSVSCYVLMQSSASALVCPVNSAPFELQSRFSVTQS
jgi:hypothetical protein